MPRPLGTPKTGGRKKGTPNKPTKDIHEAFRRLKFDIPSQLVSLLPELSPEKQADVLISLMTYVYPKRKPIDPPLDLDSDRDGLLSFLDI